MCAPGCHASGPVVDTRASQLRDNDSRRSYVGEKVSSHALRALACLLECLVVCACIAASMSWTILRFSRNFNCNV